MYKRQIEALEDVAKQLGKPMAQVALNWAVTQPAISSLVIGASSPQQMNDNLAALDFELPADARALLREASEPQVPQLYSMFTPQYQSWVVSPGLHIGDKPPTFTGPVING